MKYIKNLMLLSTAVFIAVNCSKSPEQKIQELGPRFQLAFCSKIIECGKGEIEKIPPKYRNTLPTFLQSQEACVTYFKENFDQAKEQRKLKREEATPEMAQEFENCVSALEKSSCELFQKKETKQLGVPGCEGLPKIAQPDIP
ncbi:LA_2478/LA_2722/LA_4182 family protein [Leptospira licerasiae]|uniref:LA_2478/LA_2722/LA_4182 family protein n=1 Tax=Leptospira licerasiae TaxID=447106 RepID=UPI003018A5F7